TPGSTVQTNYYRYRIHPDGVVIRSEYGPRSLGEGLTGRGCSSTGSGNGWRSCTQTTPTGRSEAEERTNFATWFSYHRTRMKAAKAGASDAFATLDGQVRVGLQTIHRRSTFNIPVDDGNDGRFV